MTGSSVKHPNMRQFKPVRVIASLLGLSFLVTVLSGAASCDPKKWDHSDIMGSGALRTNHQLIVLPVWRRGVNPDHRYNPLTWKLSPEETSTPVIDEVFDLVCVGSERQRMSCLSMKTGKHLLSVKTQGRVLAAPIIHERTLYVGTTSGVFYALSLTKKEDKSKRQSRLVAKLKWKYSADGEILSRAAILPPSQGKPSLVIFTTSNNKITALRIDTGKWVWQQRHDPPNRLSIRGQAPPVIHESSVYTGYSDGTVAAYKANNGKLLWKQSIKENDRFADVDTAPTIHEHKMYVSSYSGQVNCLRLKDGNVLWKYKLRGATRVEVRDSDLFVGSSNGTIVALNAENGKQRWKKRFRKAGSFAAPVSDDQNLYVSSTKQGIYILRPDDGHLIQTVNYQVGFGEPIVHARTLYALAYNSLLYSFTIRERAGAR